MTQTFVLTVNPTATLLVSGFTTAATAGAAHSFTITAEDVHGDVVTGFTGAVTLSSSDTQASFPVATYTFTSGSGDDNGVHTFSSTFLETAGTQSISATDTTDSLDRE